MVEMSSPSLRFGRKFTAEEKQAWGALVPRAKKELGIERLSLITPVGSFPATVLPEKYADLDASKLTGHGLEMMSQGFHDIGVGSPLESLHFLKEMAWLGFDTFQLDPYGERKHDDASPYMGRSFSLDLTTNMSLAPLTTPAWGEILSKHTLARIVENNPRIHGKEIAYPYALAAKKNAMAEAYHNFVRQTGLERSGRVRQLLQKLLLPEAQTQSPAMQNLKQRYLDFVKANTSKENDWLSRYALYEALSIEHQNQYCYGNNRNLNPWVGPKADLDRHLMAPRNFLEKLRAKLRIRQLHRKYADQMNIYKFSQFVAAEQQKAFRAEATKAGVQTMSDRQIAFSDCDRWSYPKLFMQGWQLGCPPDYFNSEGQKWGFPVMRPDRIFKPDGSLDEGGKLISRLFQKIFRENPGGVRIDHIIGFIDPWVYPDSAKSAKEGNRLYSSPSHPELAQYAYIKPEDIDPSKPADDTLLVKEETMAQPDVLDQYARILDKIILPAAQQVEQETGKPVSVLSEDLGTLTNPVLAVMKARKLSGISITTFVNPTEPGHEYRAKFIPNHPKHAWDKWLSVGTHDNPPLAKWVDDKLANPKDADEHTAQLAEDLVPNEAERKAYAENLRKDPTAFANAKWQELFTTPLSKFQVFFSDLFGLPQYNAPGTPPEQNWSLRIPQDYMQQYYDKVKDGKVPNLPDLLAKRAEAMEKPKLAEELKKFADILKE